MPIARSKVTAQRQISVPADVRRNGKLTFEDIHRAMFKGRKAEKHTIKEIKAGIAQYIIEKHARR
jgi:hypothetical protein